jgi:flagellar basal-body rod protein FlgB
MKIDDKTVQALAAAIKFREMRQELITSNLANAETPDYKAKVLDFEQALANAVDTENKNTMNSNNEKHFAVGGGGFSMLTPQIYDDPNGDPGLDGNTVDPEKEIVKMNDNEIMYEAAVQLLNKKIAMKKYILGSEK